MNKIKENGIYELTISSGETVNLAPGTAAMYEINHENRTARKLPEYGKKQHNGLSGRLQHKETDSIKRCNRHNDIA